MARKNPMQMREIENQMERQNPAVIRHEKKVRSVFDGPTSRMSL